MARSSGSPTLAGQDALEIADATGDSRETRRIASGELGHVADIAPSPDGTHVAVTAHDGRLLIVTVESAEVLELAVSDDGRIGGLAWSPDSAWLAWSQPAPGRCPASGWPGSPSKLRKSQSPSRLRKSRPNPRNPQLRP